MDAATRAELDALRLRAYGPAADIAEDSGALARLAELEELALPPAPMRAPETEDRGDGRDMSARAGVTGANDTTPMAARVISVIPDATGPKAQRPYGRSRPVWHTALVAAVALIAVPLGAVAASQSAPDPVAVEGGAQGAAGQIPAGVRDAAAFVGDPRSETLIEVRLDGYFGVDLDIDDRDVPLFPVEGPMTWVEPLGDYFGWKLWLGGAEGAAGTEACLLLDGDDTMRADCVPVALRDQGALLVSVPYDGLTAEERPAQMTPDQRIGFWWGADGAVTVLLGPAEIDSAGATSLLNTATPREAHSLEPTVIPVLIDRVTGDAIDLSTIADAPAVPASGEMTWAQPLGEHFGWQLWIGRVASHAVDQRGGDQFCILLNKASVTRSRCAADEWRAEGDLVVSLPYSQIDPQDRAFEMTPGQSIAFAWANSGYVTVQAEPAASH